LSAQQVITGIYIRVAGDVVSSGRELFGVFTERSTLTGQEIIVIGTLALLKFSLA
jgi:hypothetical protein